MPRGRDSCDMVDTPHRRGGFPLGTPLRHRLFRIQTPVRSGGAAEPFWIRKPTWSSTPLFVLHYWVRPSRATAAPLSASSGSPAGLGPQPVRRGTGEGEGRPPQDRVHGQGPCHPSPRASVLIAMPHGHLDSRPVPPPSASSVQWYPGRDPEKLQYPELSECSNIPPKRHLSPFTFHQTTTPINTRRSIDPHPPTSVPAPPPLPPSSGPCRRRPTSSTRCPAPAATSCTSTATSATCAPAPASPPFPLSPRSNTRCFAPFCFP